MTKTPKRPRDTNQLAYVLAQLATAELADIRTDNNKDPAAVSLGRKGGLKGGRARAEKLTAVQRSAIAQKAAKLRWQRRQSEEASLSEPKPQRRVLKTPLGT